MKHITKELQNVLAFFEKKTYYNICSRLGPEPSIAHIIFVVMVIKSFQIKRMLIVVINFEFNWIPSVQKSIRIIQKQIENNIDAAITCDEIQSLCILQLCFGKKTGRIWKIYILHLHQNLLIPVALCSVFSDQRLWAYEKMRNKSESHEWVFCIEWNSERFLHIIYVETKWTQNESELSYFPFIIHIHYFWNEYRF